MKQHCLEVRGEYACFTRPEMKVERVSYDVMTPSAARAIFEAIVWKPAIRWEVQKIEVMKPIRWISVRRNEVGSVVPTGSVRAAMKGGEDLLALYIEDERQQRAGLFLRDVAYRIYGRFEMTDRAGPEDNEGKFAEIFRRRASDGQCFHRPYLGCREFACDFRLIDDPAHEPAPIVESRDLGFMLYDLDFSNPAKPLPMFFRAELRDGVLTVPPPTSTEVRR